VRITDLIHHDGSGLYVSNPQPKLGETVKVYLRVPNELQPSVVALRQVRDGEPVALPAQKIASPFPGDSDTWYAADLLVHNPRTNYRWFISGGNVGYGWLTQLGWVEHDVNDAADFVITPHQPIADWARKAVIYQIFPDRFAKSEHEYEAPTWAIPRTWDQHPEGRGQTVVDAEMKSLLNVRWLVNLLLILSSTGLASTAWMDSAWIRWDFLISQLRRQFDLQSIRLIQV